MVSEGVVQLNYYGLSGSEAAEENHLLVHGLDEFVVHVELLDVLFVVAVVVVPVAVTVGASEASDCSGSQNFALESL